MSLLFAELITREIEMDRSHYYHYTECGLDNIYLLNGFQIENSINGKEVHIEDIHELHKAIAEGVISKKSRLSGSEIRFIRHMLDLSQTSLSKILGVDYQTILRWEKSENPFRIRKTADFLLRAFLYSSLNPTENEAICKMINELSELDSLDIESKNEQIDFTFDEKAIDWKIAI